MLFSELTYRTPNVFSKSLSGTEPTLKLGVIAMKKEKI